MSESYPVNRRQAEGEGELNQMQVGEFLVRMLPI